MTTNRRNAKLLAVAASLYAASAAPAWAYLDPGTGSILLQGIIAAIATVSVSISLYWRRVKSACSFFIRKIFNTHEPHE
jgi:hypothetical protein